MKCDICGKSIGETFLGKLNGTIIKIREGNKNKVYHACSECQKKFKGRLKEEVKGRQ